MVADDANNRPENPERIGVRGFAMAKGLTCEKL